MHHFRSNTMNLSQVLMQRLTIFAHFFAQAATFRLVGLVVGSVVSSAAGHSTQRFAASQACDPPIGQLGKAALVFIKA